MIENGTRLYEVEVLPFHRTLVVEAGTPGQAIRQAALVIRARGWQGCEIARVELYGTVDAVPERKRPRGR